MPASEDIERWRSAATEVIDDWAASDRELTLGHAVLRLLGEIEDQPVPAEIEASINLIRESIEASQTALDVAFARIHGAEYNAEPEPVPDVPHGFVTRVVREAAVEQVPSLRYARHATLEQRTFTGREEREGLFRLIILDTDPRATGMYRQDDDPEGYRGWNIRYGDLEPEPEPEPAPAEPAVGPQVGDWFTWGSQTTWFRLSRITEEGFFHVDQRWVRGSGEIHNTANGPYDVADNPGLLYGASAMPVALRHLLAPADAVVADAVPF